jgi:hypothetical protein
MKFDELIRLQRHAKTHEGTKKAKKEKFKMPSFDKPDFHHSDF